MSRTTRHLKSGISAVEEDQALLRTDVITILTIRHSGGTNKTMKNYSEK